MQVKKARGEMTEEEYSKVRKTLLAEYSGQTGEPMKVDGEEMKQRYGPKITARRRNPTPGETEAHMYEVKRALFGPTFNEAEYIQRQNEESKWPRQPGENERPKLTPWQQGPGVPSTMVPNPEAGGMAYVRPPGEEPGLLSRFSPSRIASAVQQVFSQHLNRQLGVRAVKYVLARPKKLLAYALMFGGSAYVLYQNWDTLGYYFNLVMRTLNYFKSGEAYRGARRCAAQRTHGRARMAQELENAPPRLGYGLAPARRLGIAGRRPPRLHQQRCPYCAATTSAAPVIAT